VNNKTKQKESKTTLHFARKDTTYCIYDGTKNDNVRPCKLGLQKSFDVR